MVACVALSALFVAPSPASSGPHRLVTAQVPVGGPPVTGVVSDAPLDPAATTTTAAPVASIVPVQAGTGSLEPTTIPVVSTAPSAAPTTVAPLTPTTTTVATGTPATRPGVTTTVVPGATTVADLAARIERALANAKAGSASVLVTIDGIGAVYEREADGLRVPASTQKLYVAGTVLLTFGGDYHYVTEVRSSALVGAGGVLAGDLVIKASGDPSFGVAQLRLLADTLSKGGLRTVQGGLVVDDSHFDAQTTIPSWKPSFTPGEVGVLGAFAVDGNHRNENDPGLANLERFRAALAAKGVTVVGASRRGALAAGGPVLASVSSAPLRDLVRQTLKKSDNTYAELLAKELGASNGAGTTANGVATIAKEFAHLGIAAPIQVDGSGLSSANRSTARGQVQWLQKLAASSVAADLRAALPISCVDGTLRSRMCNTAAASKVQAKTGALDNVVGISGYASTASGRAVTFSMLLNAVPSATRARAAADLALAAISAALL